MSTRAQKSGNRVAKLRARAINAVAGWDDTMLLDTNSVFVPVINVDGFLDHLDQCVERGRLDKLSHQFVDGGVVVQFRRKRDADVFRRLIAE